MKQIEQEMQFEKQTKNTVVYGAGADAAVPTLYIKKERLNKEPPKNIKIIIQSVDE